uniref:NADH dehydrogenase [ubiquinone] 1 beta subcomplex subunit 11, mitochondrial n=1 Tax=Ixodes ricinus TaxID=34613 RepID=V5HX41_IXORI
MAVLLRRSALYRAFNLNKSLRLSCANISTTKKNKEVPSTTISDTGVSKPPVTVADFADTKPRYWMTYGYSETDYTMDRDYHHLVMFFGITFMLGLGFIMMYIPDFRDRRTW